MSSLQLIAAARHGDLREIIELLNQNIQIDYHDDGEWTALMEAAYRGYLEVVRELIKNDASIDIRCEWSGHTALTLAILNAKLEVVRDSAD